MNLDEYMNKFNLKNRDIAEAAKITEGMVSKLRALKAIPSLPMSLVISKVTKFMVSVPELISQQKFDDFLDSRGIQNFDINSIINNYRTKSDVQKQSS